MTRSLLDFTQEVLDIFRAVRKIGVHFEDEIEFVFYRPFESGDIGPSQTLLLFAVKDKHFGFVSRQTIGYLTGAVGRIVVDNQHVNPRIERKNSVNDLFYVIPLIVGGKDNKGSWRC